MTSEALKEPEGLRSPSKAITMLERALALKERELGRDHPEVAITLTKLANAHGSLGAAAKQRDLLDRARAIREREPSTPASPSTPAKTGDKASAAPPPNEATPLAAHLVIWATLAAVVAGFVALFTGMGVGVWYVIRTRRLEPVGFWCGSAAAVLLLAMGVLDAGEWRRTWLRNGVAGVAGACLVVYALLNVDHYAYGPLCFFVLGVPVALCVAGAAAGGDLDGRLESFGRLGFAPLATCGLVAGVAWGLWVGGVPFVKRSGNTWPESRDAYGERLSANGVRCRETHEEHWMDDDEIEDLTPYARCLEVALLWVSPCIYALALLVFAAVARLVARTEKVAKKLGVLVAFLGAGVWCAASLAGAAHGVSTALFAACFAGCLGLAFVAAHVHGLKGLVAALAVDGSAARGAFDKFVAPYLDAWKGLLVLVAWPPFLGYLLFSCLRRAVRGARGTHKKDGAITGEAAAVVGALLSWDLTPVLRFAALWGFGVVALTVVVSKFTVLLMSVVVSMAADSTVGVATAIIVLVGLGLFLLPPVPGAPIYLAAGVLLTENGTKNGMTVVMAVCYANAISLGTKLVACTLQQKVIGSNLKHRLAVRRLCSVNSAVVRTMRLVLLEPGLSLAKVTILVGGPDWPTSVLCGILGLDLLPILLGTLPVFLLILPTVMGGAFLSIDESYAQVASVLSVACAAAVQTGSLVVAAVELDRQMAARKDELDDVPIDEEVRAADDADAERRRRLAANTRWARVPGSWRAALAAATVFMTASSYLCTYWSSDCFREFAIDDSVAKRLGHWSRILKPPGVFALALFTVSCVIHGAFHFGWFRHQTHATAADGGDGADA
mmetsp:Transcript_15101/g.52321  ORF Transcript_15101/g.52321 Transcript_15101/m.52321 type:complete len:839 (+) Transcript_15101:97-2613(+)